MKRRRSRSSFFELSPPLSNPVWRQKSKDLIDFLKSGPKTIQEIIQWKKETKFKVTTNFLKNIVAYLSVEEIASYDASLRKWKLIQ